MRTSLSNGVERAPSLVVALSIAVFASGCTDAPELTGSAVETRSDALDFSYTQPANLPTTTTNPFTGTPTYPNAGSGLYDNSGTGNSDIFACRSCSFTSYYDLGLGLRGQEQSRSLNTSLSSALSTYGGSLWSYGTNTGLKGRMVAATADASASFSGSYASDLLHTINAVASLVEAFPGATGKVHPTQASPQTWGIAFRPIQVRALTATSTQTFIFQPVLLRQARFRGARSYCAMRQAAREQRNSLDTLDSLGAQSIGSWWLWDYGNGESTVKIGGPVQVGKEPGQTQVTSTGANAFVIPVAIGTKVTPLHGPLFPDFPEVVHPLVWVTGDAEVESHEGSRYYLNGQHADFWGGQYVDQAGLTIDQMVLFTWGGLISLEAAGGMSMTMGKPVDGLCGTGAHHSALGDARVNFLSTGFNPPYSCTNLPGFLDRSNHWDPLSGPTNHRPSAYASDAPMEGAYGTFNLVPKENDGDFAPWGAVLPIPWGMLERFDENDDRSVVLMDTAEEHLSLSVDVGLNFGPVHVGIAGTSSVSDETVQLTTVRDHMSLAQGTQTLPEAYGVQNTYGNAILPQTNFVVASETTNVPAFDPLTLDAHFDFEITLPLVGTIDVNWDEDFFKLDGYSSTQPAPDVLERRRLRVGEYSDFGDDFSAEGTTKRVVMSHLPSPSDPPHFFSSFPNGTGAPRDVPTCLADTSAPSNPPAPAPGATGQQKSGEICWYGPGSPCEPAGCNGPQVECYRNLWDFPLNACDPTVQSQWLSQFGGSGYTCLSDLLAYLCSGTHVEQTWGIEGNVISHVYNPATEAATIANLYDECAIQLLQEENPPTQQQALCDGAFYGQLFKMHSCKSDASLDGKDL